MSSEEILGDIPPRRRFSEIYLRGGDSRRYTSAEEILGDIPPPRIADTQI
jgi:hypothetical protein